MEFDFGKMCLGKYKFKKNDLPNNYSHTITYFLFSNLALNTIP